MELSRLVIGIKPSWEEEPIQRKRPSYRNFGFTLIEMMIVIAVIALLIGVLLPNFRGTQDEAAEQKARAELRTLATAIESYAIHNSSALPALLSTLTSASPRIVSSIPDDPFRSGGADYSYATSANGIYYVVWSYGRDRAADITGVGNTGLLSTAADDDPFVTNGTGTTS